MSTSHRTRAIVRRFVILIPLLVLAAVLSVLISRNGKGNDAFSTPAASRETAAEPRPTASLAIAEHQADFRQWIKAASPEANAEAQAKHIAAGVALATARRPLMERLIRENPEQAIAEAITFAEWAALPPDVQALVKKPFSIVANYDFHPVCTPPGTASCPATPA